MFIRWDLAFWRAMGSPVWERRKAGICKNLTWTRDCHVRFQKNKKINFFFCISRIILFIYNNQTSGTTRGTSLKRIPYNGIVGGPHTRASHRVRALPRRQGREPEPKGLGPHMTGSLSVRAPVYVKQLDSTV